MGRATKNPTILLMLAQILASGCGIEVGNPHGAGTGGSTGKPQGAVSIDFADAPSDTAQHFYLDVQGLTVRAKDAQSDMALKLSQSGAIDALRFQGNNTLGLVAAQALPVGDYEAVRLALDSNKPASIVDQDGTETDLPLATGSTPAVVVQQSFSITEGEVTSLTLHVDLRRSVRDGGTGPHGKLFDPLIGLQPRGQEATLGGKVTAPDGSAVCAYLFDPASMTTTTTTVAMPAQGSGNAVPANGPDDHSGPGGPGDHPPESGPGPGGPVPGGPGGPNSPADAQVPGNGPQAAPPPPLPPGYLARNPPHQPFGGHGPDQDNDGSCPNAFGSALVRGGEFQLFHLAPGRYDLKVFPVGGGPGSTLANDVVLAPGQNSQLP